MLRRTIDTIKDDIDACVGIVNGQRTVRVLEDRLAKAKDLIEYLQIHYVDVLENELDERRREVMTAQERCDRVRAKSPLFHVYMSVGDPPCAECRRKTREARKKRQTAAVRKAKS